MFAERFNGPAWFLNDSDGQALFMHVTCGTTQWGDALDPPRDCPTCSMVTEHFVRLFVGEPVVVERESPNDGGQKCGDPYDCTCHHGCDIP